MTQRFRYMFLGAFIALVTIIGVLVFGANKAIVQANEIHELTSIGIDVRQLSDENRLQQKSQMESMNPNSANTILDTHQIVKLSLESNDQFECEEAISPIELVSRMAKQEEVTYLGDVRWIHIIETIHSPKEYRGDTYRNVNSDALVQMEELYPDDTTVSETWLHVNSEHVYTEGFSISRRQNGEVLQKTVFGDHFWRNLSLGAQIEVKNPIVELPIQKVLETLQRSDTNGKTNLNAWCGHGKSKERYHIALESSFEKPIESDAFFPEPITAEIVEYEFDLKSNQLLTSKVTLKTVSGRFWEASSTHYSTIESYSMLPDDIALQYANLAEQIGE